jgi:hypothetical protein
MVRLRMVLAAALAVSAVAVLVVPASASVPAANTKFCSAYQKIGQGTDDNLSTPQAARRTLAKFKAAAKYAPAKIKKASNTIVSVLSKFARFNATNANDVSNFFKTSDFKNYGKAISTYIVYASQQCA